MKTLERLPDLASGHLEQAAECCIGRGFLRAETNDHFVASREHGNVPGVILSGREDDVEILLSVKVDGVRWAASVTLILKIPHRHLPMICCLTPSMYLISGSSEVSISAVSVETACFREDDVDELSCLVTLPDPK